MLDWGYKTDYMYTIHRNGMISVKISGKLYGNAPETLPRIGVVMNIDKRFKNVKWLGLGPHESYIDSCSSVKFDLWERKIEDMHTSYIFPQENGNRHNVKSFSLEDERNIRIYFETLDEKFDFSISEYTIENIENARHTYDLKKSDFLQLKIDMEQYGLGSASCGEEVLEKYRLYCKDFEFLFKFSGLCSLFLKFSQLFLLAPASAFLLKFSLALWLKFSLKFFSKPCLLTFSFKF